MSEECSPQMLKTLDLAMTPKPDGTFRTNTEIAEEQGVHPNTTRRHMKNGCDFGIVKKKESKKKPYYVHGKKFCILEEFRKTGCAVATSSIQVSSGCFYSVHINGIYPPFDVTEVGEFRKIMPYPNLEQKDRLMKALKDAKMNFSDTGMELFVEEPSHPNGSLKYRALVTLSNDDSMRYELFFHEGKKTKYLVVCPLFKVYVSPEDAKSVEALTEIFYWKCKPILDLLSKNGWKFRTDEDGNYVMRKQYPDHEFHRVMEGPLSDFILENSEEKYGSPQSRVSIDRSKGPREVEFDSGSMVRLVDQLPSLMKTVSRLNSAIPEGMENILRENIECLSEMGENHLWNEQLKVALGNVSGNNPIIFSNHAHVYNKGDDE